MAVQAVRDLDILRRSLTGRKRWANDRQRQAILVIANERRYLSILKSLGAAHWVAQCWRWKTGAKRVRTRIQTRVLEGQMGYCFRTFFHTVLLVSLKLLGVFVLVRNALDALVIMVFIPGTL
jgi:hypothetical protein